MEFCKVNHTHTHKSRKNPQQNYPLSGITNIQHRNIGKNVNNSQNKRSKKTHTHTHKLSTQNRMKVLVYLKNLVF